MGQWSLRLSLLGPMGERVEMAIPLEEHMAQDVSRIDPPRRVPGIPAFGASFEETVRILRRKEFRKDLFTNEAMRLGTLLAERMEDAEGWHDESRIEPAKKRLRGE